MGFSSKYPANIEHLNFSNLGNTHLFVLAEFMGIRDFFKICKTQAERAKYLSNFCKKDAMSIARAQQGYDVIVLRKVGNGAQPAQPVNADLEKRVLGTVMDLLVDQDARVNAGLKVATDAFVDKMTKPLTELARKLLAEAADNYRPLAVTGLGKPKKVTGVLPPEFERMVKLATQRIPIMLVGPAGCGKTYLCEKLAEGLGLEFADQSCSEGMSESVFNGLLLPIGKGGEFAHVASPFMECYENGGVMLLDEIDAGDPNLFTYINKAVANKSYTVAQRYKKPRVVKHDDFVLVAAANTFGHGADAMYVGRNQLDAATLDRFRVGLISMDYSEDVEKSLAPIELCQWAWKIRANIRKHKLRRIMSTRVIENMAKMTVAYKWDRKNWDETYFTSWPVNERTQALEGV